ncbi:MAG: bifunctional 5,10-methylenetetrahydrofolate dehydrogenase/5,10-methenyltetrahydrofolate cyclohydrolase [Patescibacteria group bacterium]
MSIVNGTEIAKEILERLKKEPQPKKFLAAILVGDDPASTSFIRQKEKVGKELGVDFRLHTFPADIAEEKLKEEILKITSDENCGAVLVQLPLPSHIDRQHILNCVPKEKDVDVLGKEASEMFFRGENSIHPPAVAVVEEIIDRLKLDVESLSVAVIGVGLLVGKPISLYFESKVKKLDVFHRSSGDVKTQLKDFNLIISGAGTAQLFSAKNLGSQAVVIDFGYGDVDGKMAGDFDPAGAEVSSVSFTPTPGGTGPILVAKLYQNFYKLNML